jgi:hypothetical protein
MKHLDPPTIDRPLYAVTLAAVERLIATLDDEHIASATLTERVAALDMLCRALDQFKLAPSEKSSEQSSASQASEKEVVSIEQQLQDRRGESPPGAGANPEHARPVSGGCVWATLRQDRGRED